MRILLSRNILSHSLIENEQNENSLVNLQNESESESGQPESEAYISDDPALWKINDRTREYIIKNGIKQNSETGFSASERMYGVKKRYCTKSYFHKRLQNGDLKTRDWLVYSPSKGFVVCAYCKLFGNEAQSNFCEGFNDWKNVYIARKLSCPPNFSFVFCL